MQLTKISVSGFRGFVDLVTIDDLNRVNVFVGKNNTGKTNILEILRLLQDLSQTQPKIYRPLAEFFSFGKDNISIKLYFKFAEEERNQLIEDGLKGQKIVKDLLKTNFMRSITYELRLTRNDGVVLETISTQNIVDGDIVTWRISIDNNMIKARGSDIFAACAQLGQIKNVDIQFQDRNQRGKGYWEVCWNALNADVLPQKVKSFFIGIDWTPPLRQSQSVLGVAETRRVDVSGSNMPQVWNTIVSDNPPELVRIGDKIAKIIDIELIRAPVRVNQTIPGFKERSGLYVDLSNTSSGLHQISILVTKILTTPKDCCILIEEPELHLHAGAQRALQQLILEHSNDHQFFITTHSTIFTKISTNSSIFLIRKSGMQSSVKLVSEKNEMKFIKWELGHNNTDLYGFNLVVFVEGDTEETAIPIIAEALGYNLTDAGIWLQNVKGKDKVRKIDQYLEYLKDSDTVPFVIADGDKEIKNKLNDWERSGLLPKGNYKVWDNEFEDLYPLDIITECCTNLGYNVTLENLNKAKGDLSIVHAIKRILYESGLPDLDKVALAESIANKVTLTKDVPTQLHEVIKKIYELSSSQSNST